MGKYIPNHSFLSYDFSTAYSIPESHYLTGFKNNELGVTLMGRVTLELKAKLCLSLAQSFVLNSKCYL
ncbi:hypothetical protein BGP_0382 [Beggiatoa sp. PS]|nr:hypothetical protein BGP_0382 [Beggiatoa sp. PS]